MKLVASCTVLLPLLLVGISAPNAGEGEADIPAFPGAEGAGAHAAGGRGGSVYRVTNLNLSGPGSLADGVSHPHRIIVFTVSGTIDLSSGVPGRRGKMVIDQPHITIAGQTAPGEGICLKHGCLEVRASDVIIRHLRVRRGFVVDGDSGDAVTVKPRMKKAEADKTGIGAETRARIAQTKAERGKQLQEPAQELADILLDHVSASWATDENLTMTHPNRTTASYCIIAEGLDYHNERQTPPRHSEGSLWGVSAPNGRSTFHHNLYAHNRLRNPRTTGGASPHAVLEFCNNVVYNASEHFSHTGHEPVHLNWVGNYYKYGPSTPTSLRGSMFEFEHSRDSRMWASGNFIFGFPEATQENWKAVRFGKKLTPQDEGVIRIHQPLPSPRVTRQSAEDAYETVLAEAGATLPSRDAVDLRIARSVRDGTGRVIDKETDLAPEDRWQTYHSLPAPADRDADGIPDYWEEQFGLDPDNAKDATLMAAGGYANIEHYFNNTDPQSGKLPLVFVSGAVSRASRDMPGAVRIHRTGSTAQPLAVLYQVAGDAEPGKDYEPLGGQVVMPAGQTSVLLPVRMVAKEGRAGRLVVVNLLPSRDVHRLGCPAAALVALR
jgi:large repetitive protein